MALNRAVALAEVQGPAAALAIVDGLDLDGYYLLHAIRADLLARLGRVAESVQAYEQAIGLAQNVPERDLLARKRQCRCCRLLLGAAEEPAEVWQALAC